MFPNGKGGNADSEIKAARPELAAVVTEVWEGCQGIRGSWQGNKAQVLDDHCISQIQAGLDFDFFLFDAAHMDFSVF